MQSIKTANTIKCIFRFFQRRVSLLLIAFMLGLSNVIMEETRMVNDTKAKIEYQELMPDEDSFK
jgi:hypothetical protein